MNNSYVYVYKHPETDIPFYIGKGKNDRLFSHLYEAQTLLKLNKSTDSRKLNMILNILRNNKEPIILKLEENLSETDAFNIEKDYIKKFGRINNNTGCLTNLTDGGTGTSGYYKEEKKNSDILSFELDNVNNIIKIKRDNILTNMNLEYRGVPDEINDLVNLLNRKFRKYLRINGFDSSIFNLLKEFIDTQINENIYDLEKVIKQNKIFFYFIQDNTDMYLGIANNPDDNILLLNNNGLRIVVEFDNYEDATHILNTLLFDYKLTKNTENKYNYIHNIETLIKSKLLLIKKPNTIIDNHHNKYQMISSSKVCELLSISKQTLSNWRKSNRIKFTKISERIYEYDYNDIGHLIPLNNKNKKLLKESIDDKKVTHISNNNIPKKEHKLPTSLPIDYKEKIREWVKIYSYQVTEQKYKKQNFFLNFGNVGFVSSPHVMITDDFKLFDYIKKVEIYSDEKEVWQYLENLSKEGKNPRIDTSKRIYSGFANLYLNKLYEPLERHN